MVERKAWWWPVRVVHVAWWGATGTAHRDAQQSSARPESCKSFVRRVRRARGQISTRESVVPDTIKKTQPCHSWAGPPRRYCARAPPLATIWIGASLCGRLRVSRSMPPRRAERAAMHHARKGRIQCGADTTLAARAAAPSGRQAPRARPPCSTVGIRRAPNVRRAYRSRLSPPLR